MVNFFLFGELEIIPAPTLETLTARFVCCMLMHLNVEGDIRNGQKMMKYTINHPESFNLPKIAFCIGLMQFIGGLACEFACIFFLSTISLSIDVIIKFIALGSIAKIDDFYASALPEENKVKKNKGKANLKIENHRRIYLARDGRTNCVKCLGVLTKVIRIFYCSFIFYFIPFLVLFIPYASNSDQTPQYSATFDSHFEGLINNLGSIWQ
jgi:hypothetical protein